MKDMTNRYKHSSVIPLIDDIYDLIDWGDFARMFFPDHSVTWFYNKMRGVDGNGGVGVFTEKEMRQFSEGLVQLSEQIRLAANRITPVLSGTLMMRQPADTV
jgi:hypothetical protein